MADNDQSIYNLRFNQVSNEIEGFGGGTPQWTTLTITNVDPSQVPSSRTISTTAPLTGGGDLSANRTIAIPVATAIANGYLSSADWTTFNGKQSAGSYITALTGDVTASGPGSAVATLATVNADVGSFTSANITVDAQGRITAAANGSGGGGSPAGPQKAIQFNSTPAGSFTGDTSLTYLMPDGAGGPSQLIISDNPANSGGINFDWLMNPSVGSSIRAFQTGYASLFSQIVFHDINNTGANLFLESSNSVVIGPAAGTFNHSFQADGTFYLSALGSLPASPVAGELAFDGTNINYSTNGVWHTIQPTISSVLSAATVGGAAQEEVTVAGLLTTSTIIAVSQQVPGGNSLPLLGWTNVLNGSLNVIYSADMGAGAQVLVSFI